MRILHIAPSPPRASGIINYAERFRTLLAHDPARSISLYHAGADIGDCESDVAALIRSWRASRSLANDARSGMYDLIQVESGANCYPEFFLSVFLGLRRPSIPMFITMHDPPYLVLSPIQHFGLAGPSMLQRLLKRVISFCVSKPLESFVIGRAAGIIVLSDAGSQAARKRFPQHAHKFTHAPLFVYRDADTAPAVKDDGLILSAGYWTPRRGVEVLLEALEVLRRDHRQLLAGRHLVIAGGVLPDKTSERYFRDISERVRLGGWGGMIGLLRDLPAAEYEALFDRAAIYVSSEVSRNRRCIPASANIVRAVGSACAIIAPDLPGTAEFIRHGANGYVFAPGKSSDLARCLRCLLPSDATIRSFQSFNLSLAAGRYRGCDTARAFVSLYERHIPPRCASFPTALPQPQQMNRRLARPVGIGPIRGIYVDTREAAGNRAGIGRYIAGLTDAMRTIQPGAPLISVADQGPMDTNPSHRELIVPRTGLGWHWTMARHLRSAGLGSIYISTGSPIVPAITNTPTVVIVYDMASRKCPASVTLKSKLVDTLFLSSAIEKASAIVAISYATKRDLLAAYPRAAHKLSVVPPAADRSFRPTAANETIRRAYALPNQYVLAVGTIEPRKNYDRLLTAYQGLDGDLRRRYGLVIVGKAGWKCGRTISRIEQMQRTENVRYLRYVPDNDLSSLYSMASLFVYPSVFEGFGLPVLEAMQSGVPVVTSDRSSMPEIGGDAVAYCDPDDPGSIREELRRVMTDPVLAATLRARGVERAKRYSWEESARTMWSVIDGVRNRRLCDGR